MSEAVQIVKVVKAVQEGKTRVFIATPKTFFSINDHWQYIEISDDRLCSVCRHNAGSGHPAGLYTGLHLRADFPYLEILDENTIKVNQHPNCRCVLVRIRMPESD